MNVVDQQHVHHLIELAEVANGVVLHRLNELLRELLRRYVQDRLVRMILLDLDPNGVRQVRFAQTNATIDQQRIEGGATRLLGHGVTSAPRKTVAIALDEVVERIVRVQVRLDLYLTKAGNDERILDRAVGHIDR